MIHISNQAKSYIAAHGDRQSQWRIDEHILKVLTAKYYSLGFAKGAMCSLLANTARGAAPL
eukprot:6178179-Pleurochrysis_carterae.AAC.5